MKTLLCSVCIMMACTVSAEVLKGQITRTKDNVAYMQTTDGKKVPLLLDDKTYYRKKKVLNKSKRSIGNTEYFVPLMEKGDKVELIYDPDTKDAQTGAVQVSDVLIIQD